jgi:hypothetical protein
MTFMMGINEAPRQASAVGGIKHWKDGRNMPDVHAVVYYFGDLPVYMRLNLACEMPETYRIQGSKGLLEIVDGSTLSFTPQLGIDDSPSYYTGSFPRAMRQQYEKHRHQENDAKLALACRSRSLLAARSRHQATSANRCRALTKLLSRRAVFVTTPRCMSHGERIVFMRVMRGRSSKTIKG